MARLFALTARQIHANGQNKRSKQNMTSCARPISQHNTGGRKGRKKNKLASCVMQLTREPFSYQLLEDKRQTDRRVGRRATDRTISPSPPPPINRHADLSTVIPNCLSCQPVKSRSVCLVQKGKEQIPPRTNTNTHRCMDVCTVS